MKLNIKGTDKQKSSLYPEIGEQLDAIWKIINNVVGPEDAEEIRKQVQNTKQRLKEAKNNAR